MDTIQKFSSDIQKIRKSSLQKTKAQMAEDCVTLLERSHPTLTSLARSFGQYWLSLLDASTNTLSEQEGDVLCALHALLEGEADFTTALEPKDWKELCTLTSYEAEDIPLESLNTLMSLFVDKGAL